MLRAVGVFSANVSHGIADNPCNGGKSSFLLGWSSVPFAG
jgi:hypothetical protein